MQFCSLQTLHNRIKTYCNNADKKVGTQKNDHWLQKRYKYESPTQFMLIAATEDPRILKA